jgi:hypothetical protein
MHTVYKVNRGIVRVKNNNNKYLSGIVLALVVLAGTSTAAFAAGNSTSGIDRYLANPGRMQAGEVDAQCGSGAGSGAFGYLGKENNEAGGANGYQTGLNNSALCGNRP